MKHGRVADEFALDVPHSAEASCPWPYGATPVQNSPGTGHSMRYAHQKRHPARNFQLTHSGSELLNRAARFSIEAWLQLPVHAKENNLPGETYE